MNPIVGEAVPNVETRRMVEMIRDNKPLCGSISRLLAQKIPRPQVAIALRRQATEALHPWLKSLDEFTRAAVLTALRRTVDWEAVISLVLVDPEAN